MSILFIVALAENDGNNRLRYYGKLTIMMTVYSFSMRITVTLVPRPGICGYSSSRSLPDFLPVAAANFGSKPRDRLSWIGSSTESSVQGQLAYTATGDG